MLVDSHVHLNRSEFRRDLAAVLDRAAAAGVTRLLNVGYDPPSSEESVALAEAHPQILASVGVHPHDASLLADPEGRPTAAAAGILERLESLTAHPPVVAVGEIGLDFFRDLSPHPAQRTAFALQLQLARKVGLPVIFHIRDAYAETAALVETIGPPGAGGVLHAFAGDLETVEWAQRHGLLLGIGGPVTYPKSRLPELLRACRVDDILLETDAPWLPPTPHRGQRNEPAYLRETALKVAALFDCDLAELANTTSCNFDRLFAAAGGCS